MDNRDQYIDTYNDSELQVYRMNRTTEPAAEAPAPKGIGIVAKVLLWILGSIVGLTVLFGCGIFWIWGLDYIGVINYNRAPVSGQNEFNQPSGGYNEFEDFYNYFDDFFGGQMPNGGGSVGGSEGNGGNSESADPQAGTPGIGVTIQALAELDFAIDEIYTGGLVVIEISETGALVGKDVQIGDLIVAANGTPITSIEELDVQLKATGVGGNMTLTIARFVNGVAATHEIEITLIDLSAAD